MPRVKKVQATQQKEVQPVQVEVKPVEPTNEAQPLPPNKEEYLKARATIKQYRESQKAKPKRKCSEKQLAALAAGREKNKRYNKSSKTTE